MPVPLSLYTLTAIVFLCTICKASQVQRIAAFDTIPSVQEILKSKKDAVLNNNLLQKLKKDSAADFKRFKKVPNPFKNIKDTSRKFRMKFNGGFVSYNTNYRSINDTPFLEKGIVQHTINGNANVTAGFIPLQVGYFIRESNSVFFRDIIDVQVNMVYKNFSKKYIGRYTAVFFKN